MHSQLSDGWSRRLTGVVKWLMRCATLQVIVAVAVLLPGLQRVLADENLVPMHFRYEKVAITNGRTVLSAVLSGDAQSKTNVQALIGSKVVFVGGAAPPEDNANLVVWSNVVVEVELRPSRNVIPRSVYWEAEVLGTLQSVDFKRKIIRIRAKPDDWRHQDTY